MWSSFWGKWEQRKTKKKPRSSSVQMPRCNVRNRFCECFHGYYTTAHRKCQLKPCGQLLKGTTTMWSGIDQITWSKYVVEAENSTPFLPPQVLYCNSSSNGCQGPLKIKSELKIWYAVNKEKARRDHFHHQGANRLPHMMGDGRILFSGESKRLSELKNWYAVNKEKGITVTLTDMGADILVPMSVSWNTDLQILKKLNVRWRNYR